MSGVFSLAIARKWTEKIWSEPRDFERCLSNKGRISESNNGLYLELLSGGRLDEMTNLSPSSFPYLGPF